MKYVCEYCNKQHDGSFGSGRFCSRSCQAHYSAEKNIVLNKRTKDGKWLCLSCNSIFDSRRKLQQHKKLCVKTITYNDKIKNINSQQLQLYYFKTLSKQKTRIKFGLTRTQFYKYVNQNNIYLYSLSEIVSMNIKRHPQKYYWNRKQNRKISKPCQYFKSVLDSCGIKYYPQFQDFQQFKHFYSIDIAFPKDKLAIEINGTQHYNKNGELREYYQKRHDVLINCGWKVLQIFYTKVYNEQVQQQIIQEINNSISYNYDYSNQISKYLQNKSKKSICPICGNKKSKVSKHCRKCSYTKLAYIQNKLVLKQKIKDDKNVSNNFSICKNCGQKFEDLTYNRKREHIFCSQECYHQYYYKLTISKQDLQQLIKTKSLSEIGRIYGVSGNAIKKRCKKYNLDYKQYEHDILSRINKNNMQQKYKDYINPKQICPICGKYKSSKSKYCRECYRQDVKHQ